MTKFTMWKKWQKIIWIIQYIYPNHMHISIPWRKRMQSFKTIGIKLVNVDGKTTDGRTETCTPKSPMLKQTRQSAQWGTYTPEERYRQFLTSTKYVALTLEMVGWMNSMLIAISPKPLCRRIIKFKRSWWYSYINLDAIFFYFYMKFLSLWPWPEGHTLYLPTCQI